MHEVNFRFWVRGSDTDQEAVEMAASYFCGGDFSAQVTQHEPEVHEVSTAAEATRLEADYAGQLRRAGTGEGGSQGSN